MINLPETAASHEMPEGNSRWNRRIGVTIVLTASVVVIAVVLFALNSSQTTIHPPSSDSPYPTGVYNSAEPSGLAPTGAKSLAGYKLSYLNDFRGTTLDSGWNLFTGIPNGDPGGQFASSHVVVSNGLLQLNTWKDPAYQNRWITGGLCQCGVPITYGAYFIRSRITAAGPNEVELLWPKTNTWPPEIDFNETQGLSTSTTSTLHWGAINQIDQRTVTVDMLQWHTWGLIWTPKSITYLVDGQVWGTISNVTEITTVPMTLDFEQLAFCSQHRECPTRPTSMLIDWITEYTPT
jgi:hypothetical protein